MYMTARTRTALRVFAAIVIVFLYAPLAIVVLNAFNTSHVFAFPPTGLGWGERSNGFAQLNGGALTR